MNSVGSCHGSDRGSGSGRPGAHRGLPARGGGDDDGGTRGGQARVCGTRDPRHQRRPHPEVVAPLFALIAVLWPRPSLNAVNGTEDAEAARRVTTQLARGPGTAVVNDDTTLYFYVCKPHTVSIRLRPASENEPEGGE